MSDTTKYASILGSNFTCRSDIPGDETICPMFNDIGPQTETYTGIIDCPQCGIELGSEPSMGDELYDDDPDDDDYQAQQDGFVSEGARKVDNTPKENREVSLRRTIQKQIGPIGAHDTKIAIAIDRASNDILALLYKLEEAEVPEFMTRDNRGPLLAIALYIVNRDIPENVYKQLGLKSSRIIYLRNTIQTLDSPHKDNQLEATFTTIGRTADVPDKIIQLAYEAYLEENPYNSVDNENVLVSAWIYLFCKRIQYTTTKKAFYSNLSGVSRISFGRALKSYSDQRHNAHIAK